MRKFYAPPTEPFLWIRRPLIRRPLIRRRIGRIGLIGNCAGAGAGAGDSRVSEPAPAPAPAPALGSDASSGAWVRLGGDGGVMLM